MAPAASRGAWKREVKSQREICRWAKLGRRVSECHVVVVVVVEAVVVVLEGAASPAHSPHAYTWCKRVRTELVYWCHGVSVSVCATA